MLSSLASCAPPTEESPTKKSNVYIQLTSGDLNYDTYYFHDTERKVGIWITRNYQSSGISVLPDSAYIK